MGATDKPRHDCARICTDGVHFYIVFCNYFVLFCMYVFIFIFCLILLLSMRGSLVSITVRLCFKSFTWFPFFMEKVSEDECRSARPSRDVLS